MNNVKIGESIREGWSQLMKRPWYLIGISLALSVLFIFSSGDMAVTALAYIVYGGYIAVLLRHFRGEHIVFDDLFSIDNRWISFAFTGLIKMLLILLGLVFFIVPGVYLMIRWMFAELLVIDKGMRPLEALKASSALTEGHRMKLFGFALVGLLVIVLGLLVFVVGVIVSAIVIKFAVIKIYTDLQNAPEPVAEHMEPM